MFICRHLPHQPTLRLTSLASDSEFAIPQFFGKDSLSNDLKRNSAAQPQEQSRPVLADGRSFLTLRDATT